jgi:hypothetical protein
MTGARSFTNRQPEPSLDICRSPQPVTDPFSHRLAYQLLASNLPRDQLKNNLPISSQYGADCGTLIPSATGAGSMIGDHYYV